MTFSFDKERMTVFSPDGTPMGHITFPRIREGLVNIDRVMAYPGFRGQGLEDGMLEALLPHLDRLNQKAALTAPHAQQYVRRHTEWKHILPACIHFTSH